MLCSLSGLDESMVTEIQALEKDLGKTLLSFSCHDIQAAEVREEDLEKIKALENKLSVSLVAVK
jgi:hypothetical protein